MIRCHVLQLFLLLSFHQLHESCGFVRSSRLLETGRCRRHINLFLSGVRQNPSISTNAARGKRINRTFRRSMDLIKNRYGDDCDFRRTKMYIYRTKNLSLESMTEVLDFLDSFLPREIVQQLLVESPRILNKSVESYLRPTAEFLLNLWGEELFNQAMERNPQLLLTSGIGYNTAKPPSEEGKHQTVDEILIEALDLSKTQLNNLRRKSPFVFSLAPSKVKEVTSCLGEMLEPSGNQKYLLQKMITKNPNVLNLHVDANIRPRVDYLTSSLRLNPKELAKVMQTGAVLALSVEGNLKPTLEYLEKYLLPGQSLKKCVLAHPSLLALSLSNLRQKANALESISEDLASKVARRCPTVLSLSLEENIYPTIEFLARIWGCRPDDPAMGSWLEEYPNVLTLSVEGNIQPTMNFFNRTGYTELDDNWRLVKGSRRIPGRYIAASLFHRLLPRWHYCTINDISKPPLHVIVGASDESFCQQLNCKFDEFSQFRGEAIPRLKFSSQFDTWLKTGLPIDI